MCIRDRAKIVEKSPDDERMVAVEVTLSEWLFNAIQAHEVLTIHSDYFRLRKPLERRLYELARKQCGTQPEWKCGLHKLQDRTGSTSSNKEFRRLVKAICKADAEHNHMPDYAFRLEADILTVTPKPEFLDSYTARPQQDPLTGGYILPLSPDALERARELAPTWDTSVLAVSYTHLTLPTRDLV